MSSPHAPRFQRPAQPLPKLLPCGDPGGLPQRHPRRLSVSSWDPGPACLTMGPLSRENWAQRVATFRASPSAFMVGPEGEDLGRDLLSDLRSEKQSEQTKVSLLSLSLEYPAQLWPGPPAAEAAATSLLDTLVLLPPRPSALRRPLLLAATTALAAGGALGP
uniref:AP-5 complex subunit beta-1 n=1 Tax=Camelus bactrianus TaxID=9837 RepID=A0A9W3GU66_CAMBA